MSAFRDSVFNDNLNVFMNVEEFASYHTIKYDGVTYADVPIVMTGLKEQDRKATVTDHAQGLYAVHSVIHCRIEDLDGIQPERGTRIYVSDEDVESYFNTFYIVASDCEMGMLRLECEGIDE